MRVTAVDKGHRGRNALILGAVGAGVGAGIGAVAPGRNAEFGRAIPAAIGAGIGFAGGAVVGAGAARSRHHLPRQATLIEWVCSPHPASRWI